MPEYSRLGRIQEKKMAKRIMILFLSSGLILVILVVFGFKIFVSLSILVGNLKSTAEKVNPTPVVLLPPALDPVAEATNSASLPLSGSGQKGMTAVIYVNDKEVKKIPVQDDGSFDAGLVPLSEGKNSISAKQTDGKNLTSGSSNVLTTTVEIKAPALDLTSPADGQKISGESSALHITGKTDADNSVTANGRFVIVRADGTFDYTYLLPEGDTTISVVVTDPAGNQTKVEKKVTYER